MKGINTVLTTGRLSIVLLSALILAGCQSESSGDDGVDGFSALINISAVAAGDPTCATGGQRLETGLDLDQNGVLDSDEVDSQQTVYICNGAEGPQGASGTDGAKGEQGPQGEQGPKGAAGSLLKLTAENSVETCLGYAGYKVEVGQDQDGNGLLDADEIDTSKTTYVCQGFNSLISSEELSPGAQCIAGGYAVNFGLDTDRNKVLEEHEIDKIVYVCHGATGAAGNNGNDGISIVYQIADIAITDTGVCTGKGGKRFIAYRDINNSGAYDDNDEPVVNALPIDVCNGAGGAAGDKGDKGDDGFNLLIRKESFGSGQTPPNTSCAAGGVLITTALDKNRNEIIDEDENEIVETFYICNGRDGKDGLSVLVIMTDIAELEDTEEKAYGEGLCLAGGKQIKAGYHNGNGVLLDEPEPIVTYVCDGQDGQNGAPGQNGENGKNSLIRITTEPMGLNCPLGGQKIEVGVDLNNSGELDSVPLNEVQHITYICSSTVPAMPLNDTGMIYGLPYGDLCKNDKSGATGQDCDYGWDKVNDDGELFKIGRGAASFDFSLYLDEKENRCIKDNYTGLTWFDVSAVAPVKAYSLEDMHKELELMLDAGAICGIKGQWRLPTVIELQGIVHYGATFGSLKVDDTFVMTGTMENYSYWSGTLIKDEQPVGVDFTDGVIKPLSASGEYRFFIVVSEE